MENPLVFLRDAGGEMDFEDGFLRLQRKRAESKQVLHETVLAFMDVLEHLQLDRLVIVVRDQRSLDAVYALIGDDDDIEKMPIDRREKEKMSEHPCHREEYQGDIAKRGVLYAENANKEPQCHTYECGPRDHTYKRPEEPDPVLPEIKVAPLIQVFPKKDDIRRRVRIFHHSSQRGKSVEMSSSIAWTITAMCMRRMEKNRMLEQSSDGGKCISTIFV